MARLPRLDVPGIPQHIIQRGNNRQNCFNSGKDFAAYANWLQEYAKKYHVDIHAWVFMTNHVHLLLTPRERTTVSKMVQSVGRNYVRYFNSRYQRTGTLWEGRFKSCLVQSERYLLACYRYIELNPVRARIVDNPKDYHWSSYHANALGVKSDMLTPHSEYLSLGSTEAKRVKNYQSLFSEEFQQTVTNEIRSSINQGLVFGDEVFKKTLAEITQRRVAPAKIGRPRN